MNNYTEMKVRCIINHVEKKLDKNQQDFWILKTQLDQANHRDYLVFSADYGLEAKTKSLLINYSEQLIDHWVVLTVKKRDHLEKVIAIHLEK